MIREIDCIQDVEVGDKITIRGEIRFVRRTRVDGDEEVHTVIVQPLDASEKPTEDGAFEIGPTVLECATSISREEPDLPTQKGERFWGKTDATTPQWWFVRFSLNHPNYGLRYCPSTEEDVAFEMSAEEAVAHGLRVVPREEES